MSEEYLWNKAGASDEEVERLECVLGALRYQPSKNNRASFLDPARGGATLLSVNEANANRRIIRRFTPALAIAATLMLAIIGGSLWIKMNTPQSIEKGNKQLAATPTTSLPNDAPNSLHDHSTTELIARKGSAAQNNSTNRISDFSIKHTRQNRIVFQSQSRRAPDRLAKPINSLENNDGLIAEGERAKAQLVLALHIASDKLSFAQKKIQANKEYLPAS